jgi:hypothetical protein
VTPPLDLDYPLQKTSLDITTTEAYALAPDARLTYDAGFLFSMCTTRKTTRYQFPVP